MRTASESRTVQGKFKEAAVESKHTARKPAPKPFSIRLSEDEREHLLREAGKLSLGAHARAKRCA